MSKEESAASEKRGEAKILPQITRHKGVEKGIFAARGANKRNGRGARIGEEPSTVFFFIKYSASLHSVEKRLLPLNRLRLRPILQLEYVKVKITLGS